MEETERIAVPIPPEVDILGVLGIEDANLRALEADFPQLSFWCNGEAVLIQGATHELALATQAVHRLIAADSATPRFEHAGEHGQNQPLSGQNHPDTRAPEHKQSRKRHTGEQDWTKVNAGTWSQTGATASNPNRTSDRLNIRSVARPDARVAFNDRAVLVNRERVIRPKTPGQAGYLRDIDTHTITFGIGPAGTGKTYLAMARAVRALLDGEVSRLILTRPAVEAGETLGFLPGTLTDKIDPYLRPLYDALREMLDPGSITKMLSDGTIEVAALAYMRGRTLNGAFVVLDEAQNTTSEQMKMFLTRLGFDSKMVVTGDITQIDLPHRQPSGLRQVQNILAGVPDIAFSYLTAADVVRHSLVGEIIGAYQDFEATQNQPDTPGF